MFYIYLITNKLNGKIYVGQTEQTIEERFKDHVWSRNKQDYFHAAIRKYGKDAFVVQELSKHGTLEETNNAESLWILLLRSYDNAVGYNTTFGGQNGGRPTDETKAKIGLVSASWERTDETRKKMRKAQSSRTETTNSVGIRGICFTKGRYRVRTKFHGKEVNIGFFDTLEEAVKMKDWGLQRLDEVGIESFLKELEPIKQEMYRNRMQNRPHRGPVSKEEKENISLRTRKRWAKNFSWMDGVFASPVVDDTDWMDSQVPELVDA